MDGDTTGMKKEKGERKEPKEKVYICVLKKGKFKGNI
jgi:hypothetical protein